MTVFKISLQMSAENFETGLKALAAADSSELFMQCYDNCESNDARLNYATRLCIELGLARDLSSQVIDLLPNDIFPQPVSILSSPSKFAAYAKNDPSKKKLYSAIWGFLTFAYLFGRTNVIIFAKDENKKSTDTILDLLTYVVSNVVAGDVLRTKDRPSKEPTDVARCFKTFKETFRKEYQKTRKFGPESQKAFDAIFIAIYPPAGTTSELFDREELEMSLEDLFDTMSDKGSSKGLKGQCLLTIEAIRLVLGYMLSRVDGFLSGTRSGGGQAFCEKFKFDPSNDTVEIYDTIMDLKECINNTKVLVNVSDTPVWNSPSSQLPTTSQPMSSQTYEEPILPSGVPLTKFLFRVSTLAGLSAFMLYLLEKVQSRNLRD